MVGKDSNFSLTFHVFAYWHDPRWKKFVGATVKIWDLAHNLSEFGQHVTLFVPKYGFDSRLSSVKIVEVPFLDFPYLRLLSYNVVLCFYLISVGLKRRADIVYARRMGSIVPGLYSKLTRAVFFYEINDDPYKREFNEGSLLAFGMRKLISEWHDQINLRLCQRAFVITKDILEKVMRMNPRIPAEKLVELPSGANTQLFRPMPTKGCRARLGLGLKGTYVGFAGTLLKHQGIDILIDAAHLILAHERSVNFIIIGEGPMKNQWMNRVQREGIAESFLFPGQVDYGDMPTWIGSMDVCVAPFLLSAGLRSPVKVFDYMACGKPVVASRIEGTTDVFADSGAIRLVPPEDPKLLASQIVDLLRNPKEAEEMGRKGRRLITNKFDRKNIARRISQEALSLIKNRP